MAPLFLCVFGQKNCHMARKVAPMRGYEPGADPVVRGMLHKRGGGWCALGADFSTRHPLVCEGVPYGNASMRKEDTPWAVQCNGA